MMPTEVCPRCGEAENYDPLIKHCSRCGYNEKDNGPADLPVNNAVLGRVLGFLGHGPSRRAGQKSGKEVSRGKVG